MTVLEIQNFPNFEPLPVTSSELLWKTNFPNTSSFQTKSSHTTQLAKNVRIFWNVLFEFWAFLANWMGSKFDFDWNEDVLGKFVFHNRSEEARVFEVWIFFFKSDSLHYRKFVDDSIEIKALYFNQFENCIHFSKSCFANGY